MSIGEIIRLLRIENNMSQTALGNILYVSQDTISSWELGKSKPDFDMLRNIAIIFDISLDELMDMENYRNEWSKKQKEQELKQQKN